jgi:hypothetical protein
MAWTTRCRRSTSSAISTNYVHENYFFWLRKDSTDPGTGCVSPHWTINYHYLGPGPYLVNVPQIWAARRNELVYQGRFRLDF